MQQCDECGQTGEEGLMKYIADCEQGDYFLCQECYDRWRVYLMADELMAELIARGEKGDVHSTIR
jgi:hypothetical protein